MAARIIEAIALTKSYRNARGIEALSFEVEEGEAFGFLGPNGAGKTTTIRTLLDFLRPTSGAARIFGLDSHRGSTEIRRRTGNLPGDFAFDPHRSGRDLLELLAALRGVRGLGRSAELAERFRADLDRPLGELSRGNRQKIGLIQSLFHDPDLVILDEPTSGLDPLMQEEFLAVVREQRAAGRTVFLSSHDLSEVEQVCDRVGLIRDGRMVAVERVSDLTARGFRHVHLEFRDPVAPAAFAALPGVRDLSATGRYVDFRLAGDVDRVVKVAATHHVVDLQVTHPTLEEAFIGLYEQAERPA